MLAKNMLEMVSALNSKDIEELGHLLKPWGESQRQQTQVDDTEFNIATHVFEQFT